MVDSHTKPPDPFQMAHELPRLPPTRTAQGDEADLAARISDRDEDAFVIVYDRYADLVFGTTLRFVRDREAATEIVQDAFLSVWRRGHQFDARSGSLAGWILGIARNRAIDQLRAQGRRPRLAGPISGEHGQSDALAAIDSATAANGEDAPGVALNRRWLRALLRNTLAGMPTEERQVVVLAYDRGLSQSEIAEHLAIPIGTVKSRTRRALASLRDHLADVPDLRSEPAADPEGLPAVVQPRSTR